MKARPSGLEASAGKGNGEGAVNERFLKSALSFEAA
jgi:hypothetical protein